LDPVLTEETAMPERDDLYEFVEEDLVDGPVAVRQGWAATAGRGLGVAARAVADGVDALAALLNPCTWTAAGRGRGTTDK
jgi:hypothetical protein